MYLEASAIAEMMLAGPRAQELALKAQEGGKLSTSVLDAARASMTVADALSTTRELAERHVSEFLGLISAEILILHASLPSKALPLLDRHPALGLELAFSLAMARAYRFAILTTSYDIAEAAFTERIKIA